MKCPYCVEEGKRSKVYDLGGSVTLMGGNFSFYDENGIFHHHDPNMITSYYSCTNDHHWSERRKASCPTSYCDWNKNNETQRIRNFRQVQAGTGPSI